MYGTKIKTICIAGKNKCAIKALEFVINQKKKFNIVSLTNNSDNGKDSWQKSFKRYCSKKKIKILKVKDLYKIKNLFLFSLEYEHLLKNESFKSNNLFNFHFSLLPKYRGCHTNFYQILNGEKISGVSLHKIDKGIDTGAILDQITFKIKLDDTAYQNYLRLMDYSFLLFKKNFNQIIKGNYKLKKQNLKKGSYFSRESVNYKSLINIKKIDNKMRTHNLIRSLIFPAFQYPIYKGKKIKKSIFFNKKIKLNYL